MVEPYLGFLPHDEPLSFVTWTYLAAGAELAGAAGLTLGLWTRLSALSLFSTMGAAYWLMLHVWLVFALVSAKHASGISGVAEATGVAAAAAP